MGAGTLEVIARQLSLVLEQLPGLVSPDPGVLFKRLGLNFSSAVLGQPAIANPLNTATTAAGKLNAQRTALETAIAGGDATAIISAGAALLQTIGTLIAALDTLANAIAGLPPASVPGLTTADLSAYAANFSRRVLADLAVSYMSTIIPTFSGVLAMAGVLDNYPNLGDPSNAAKPAYMVRDLHLDRIGVFLKSPTNLLQSLYGWGNATWDAPTFLGRVSALLGSLGFVSSLKNPTPGTYFIQSLFLDVQPDMSVSPEGLTATLHANVDDGFTSSLPLGSNWTATIVAHGGIAAETSLKLAPPVQFSLTPPSGKLNGDVTATLSYSAGTPLTLIGVAGGTRLDVGSCSVGCGLTLTWNSTSNSASVDWLVQAALKSGKAVIDMTGADGFLATVLSGVHVEADFDLTISWHADTGIHIEGGAQLEIDLPLHLDLGPVTLPTLYLVGGTTNGAITLEISAGLGITLGPIAGSVDRVGLLGTLSFPQSGGNLGPADLQFKFKPPNGLGLAIDAGLATGGGYITFDPDHGRYAGVFQLTLVNIVQVNIIGVLDTIMPDGSQGFSFLLIITFGFPPIQLGFGFTLDTVGGIGGVNRTMLADALRSGFRAHTLSSVIAPSDPIANAPQIISDIRNFFPVAVGRYIFGPIVGIGWGTPTLISLTVGVILEVPDPIRLVILGLIDAGLPTKELGLIELHIDVLGIIDFGAKTLSIDGSLYDSRILIFSLAGDLALRLSWGDNPNFVFSLGGFNPHFNTNGLNVPANMQRMSVSIGDGDNPRISSNSYFAVTSNTLQFGANVDAYASAGGFSVHGYLGFDVLIIISPFSFEFDFSAGFDVAFEGATLAGLNVNGLFSGPTPWHFHGDASITFLFITVSASLDLTWGDSTQATLPQRPVLPDLFAALQNPASWSATLPDGATAAVSLMTQDPSDKTLRVHPMGTLQVKEKIVPLDLPITRYGNATPADGTEFSIDSVQINTQPENIQKVPDYFAAGQFLTLSDADKLSKPSFEKFDAGVIIGSSAVKQGQDSHRPVTYQEHYIDDPAGFSRFSRYYHMPADVHLALSAQGAGFNSAVKNTGLAKYGTGPAPTPISVQDPQYVVTSVTDLSLRSDIVGQSTSYFQANAALQSHLSDHPEDAGSVQIMPMHEVTP
jgi:hypothetical protein